MFHLDYVKWLILGKLDLSAGYAKIELGILKFEYNHWLDKNFLKVLADNLFVDLIGFASQ